MTVTLLLLIQVKMKNQLIIMSKLFDLNTTTLSHLSLLKKKIYIYIYLTFQVSNKIVIKKKNSNMNIRRRESEI